MNHFLHKHRHWFFALILLTVAALAYFQFRDDGGNVPGMPNKSKTPVPGMPIQPNPNSNIPGMPIQPTPNKLPGTP